LEVIQIVKPLLASNPEAALEIAALFEGELNPVAPKAQGKVPIPEGLDLDKWINEPPRDPSPPPTRNEPITVLDLQDTDLARKKVSCAGLCMRYLHP
jgi:AP-3 complex subunit delta-1